jgi:hypothetical protein
MKLTDAPGSDKSLWAGRILSALAVLLFVVTGAFSLVKPDAAMRGFAHFGFPQSSLLRICIAEIVCALLYAIPSTSVLGAVLLTGYLGGAIATHVRVGEPIYIPIVIAIVVWLGLFLREPRLRELLPLRN